VALFGRPKSEPEPEHTNPEVTAVNHKEKESSKIPKRPASPAQMGPSRKEGMTVIGKSITIKGELSGEEDIKVEGRVEGRIIVKRNVLVGQTGVIEADIEAENISIAGTVMGNIKAGNKVEIVSTGRMNGDIKAPRVIVAEGAHFKGNVDMDTSSRTMGTMGNSSLKVKDSEILSQITRDIPSSFEEIPEDELVE
jgi:cytoskeletal protein CcmA (bactofilin family)